MRPARRRLPREPRRRADPGRARVTVKRAVADLRRGREALSDIQAQLDTLLASLRAPGARIDGSAPERLAGARREAGRALAALADLRRLLP